MQTSPMNGTPNYWAISLDPDELDRWEETVDATLTYYRQVPGELELQIEFAYDEKLLPPLVLTEFAAAIELVLESDHHRIRKLTFLCPEQIIPIVIPIFTLFNFSRLEGLGLFIYCPGRHRRPSIPSSLCSNLTNAQFPRLHKLDFAGQCFADFMKTDMAKSIPWHQLSLLKWDENIVAHRSFTHPSIFQAIGLATNLTECDLDVPGAPPGEAFGTWTLPNVHTFRLIAKRYPNLNPILSAFVLPSLNSLTIGLRNKAQQLATSDIACPADAIKALCERGGSSLTHIAFSKINFNTAKLIEVLRVNPKLEVLTLSRCVLEKVSFFHQIVYSTGSLRAAAIIAPMMTRIILHVDDIAEPRMPGIIRALYFARRTPTLKFGLGLFTGPSEEWNYTVVDTLTSLEIDDIECLGSNSPAVNNVDPDQILESGLVQDEEDGNEMDDEDRDVLTDFARPAMLLSHRPGTGRIQSWLGLQNLAQDQIAFYDD